jgi:hypothetical protein
MAQRHPCEDQREVIAGSFRNPWIHDGGIRAIPANSHL